MSTHTDTDDTWLDSGATTCDAAGCAQPAAIIADTLLQVDQAGTAATARHRRERAGGIVRLWTSSPTITPIAGTRWAAYNAVTEYLDHIVPVRGARTAGDASAARALRGISASGSTGSLKAEAFHMLQTL